MAATLDIANDVLDVFSRLKRTEMTLIELHNHLSIQNNGITIDDVLRLIRLSSLMNLFNLQPSSNNLYLVQLAPKLTLCELCLQKGCKKKENCTKLHLCRYASHFTDKPLEKPCRFAHKLSGFPNNLNLLRRFDLHKLNEDLLLNLLRLHYTQSQVVNQNHHPIATPTPNSSRPPSRLKKSPLVLDNPLERQIDVSIPPERDASDIDLEIVQLLLATKSMLGVPLLNKQISNEFYRRFTLQFSNKQPIDHLIANEPIMIHCHIPIKIKRTQKRRDTKLFALKFLTNKKIDQTRLNLYVETLIGKGTLNIFDMTSDENHEQIYLIRSEQSIDFDLLYKAYSAKNTLQGYRIIIIEIYETETLEISFVHGPTYQSMTLPRLQKIIGEKRWEKEVFACLSIHNQQKAEIELMNSEITAKWLSQAHQFERDYSLLIQPVIDFIPTLETTHKENDDDDDDDDDDEVSNLLANSKKSSKSSIKDEENSIIQYNIKPDWRVVLTHPVFGDEYRKYIREHLNISVQNIGLSIEVPNEHTRKELARLTNMFIQKFIFQEVVNPDKAQVKLIKENYSRMAHKWQQDTNKTLIIARRDVMNELFPRLSSATPQLNKTLHSPVYHHRQSPNLEKCEQQSTPKVPSSLSSSPKPIQTKITEKNYYIFSYSIENDVYIPLFSPSNPFPTRLFTYLSNTFNVKLEIKHITQTKISLELKGLQKDTSDARSALTVLFTSLKTKIYSSTNDTCQFSIPDFYHVAQYHLNQYSIISSCSFSPKNDGILFVRYFSNNPHFGTDEDKLDDILLHTLCGQSFSIEINTKNLEKKLQEFIKQIEQRSDYRQTICFSYDHQKKPSSIELGGIKSIVRQFYQDIQKIYDEHIPVVCHVPLQQNEVDYLLKICSNELIKYEKRYENDGVNLCEGLKNQESTSFLAPKYLHEKTKLFLLESSRTESISGEFLCSPQLIDNTKHEINKLATKSQCLINIRLVSSSSVSSSQSTAMSTVNKNYSKAIHISMGDLAAESADVLVVCSTSGQLRNAMIRAAGRQVEQELTGQDITKNIIRTSAGQLKQAKRLFFIPWMPPSTTFTNQDIPALRQSITAFVEDAINYTIKEKLKSIAFPAIGCGGFGIPAEIIATTMINAVNNVLTTNPTIQLTVFFVMQQANVFDIFKATLRPSSSTYQRRSPPPSSSSSKLDKFNITVTTNTANIDTARKLLAHYHEMLKSYQ